MNDPTDNRPELIQRYVDQTITDDELCLFQEMLKEDASLREELLLYVRMDVAIREYVLFHNYMEDNEREGSPPPMETPISQPALSRLGSFYQKVVSCLFSKGKLQ